jgi:SAM-dependent methyltransferase/predicted transcriptional regulator
MNQQWLIDHVLETMPSVSESPENERVYLTQDEARAIVDQTLDELGAHGDPTEYTYMRGHRTRLEHTLTMIPKADHDRARLLDVGSYGYMAVWAKIHLGYSEVVGIEWHPDRAESVLERELRVGDCKTVLRSHNFDISADDWDIDGKFDTVLFFEVLEHINTDPMGVMDRVNRSLKPGGTLVMSVPNAVSYKTLKEFLVGMPPWTYWFYEPDLSHEPRHCFEYTPIVFQSLLAASGMETVAFRTIYSYSTPSNEQEVLRVADALGYSSDELGETMIAHATKTREGVSLRYPDVLYSPDGYYKNVYPLLQQRLQDRLASFHSSTHPQSAPADAELAAQVVELKRECNSVQTEKTELIASLEQELASVTRDRDAHKDWSGDLRAKNSQMESQITQLLFQSDCRMQQEQQLREEILGSHRKVEDAYARLAQAEERTAQAEDQAGELAQQNAEMRTQVDELLFACDCYLQQINDPARCVQVIRQRRFRWALDRSKAIARKTPIARTMLRPVYRNAKRVIKRRM